MLLGHEWTEVVMPSTSEHVVQLWREGNLWRWECSCGLHLGYGNVRDRVVAAAERHAKDPKASITV